MAHTSRRIVNRGTLIVKAKRPMLDWLGTLPDPTKISLKQINEESTSYLLPSGGLDETDPRRLLKSVFQAVFETELESWWRDTADWPDTTDFKLFQKWFKVEYHCMTWDLDPGPIRSERV